MPKRTPHACLTSIALLALLALAAFALSCNARPSQAEERPPAQTSTQAAETPEHPERTYDPVRYEAALKKIEAKRLALAERYATSKDKTARLQLRAEARRFILDAINTTIFPAWMGSPWGLGRNSTAQRPFEKDMVVGCSYFLTSVLQNAGLRLDNRYHFAQAPALEIQRSLAPAPSAMHRFLSISPAALEERVRALGDGLYVIGLNNHVGFVVVDGDDVDVVHASYTSDKVVVRERMRDAEAIANSQKAGYFVSSVFADARLVEMWIKGREVPFTGKR